ncbi:MAG: MmgE/PrpD family protein, partial [Betaproteobacteria bacterium]
KAKSTIPAARLGDVPAFGRELAFTDLPADVVAQARRCVLDLAGTAAGGSRTDAARIANHYATTQLRSSDGEARLLFDGRRASAAGAAFAGAATIDSLDAHDGHVLTKGHAGVAVLPALLAFIDSGARCDDREFITCIVLGYEIATRAGIALHATVPDFHCSGAWNALAGAAIGARLLGFDREQTRQAMGIAEYWGPRGQIMRVCDSPSMVKDGSSWGAHAGVSAALLAGAGFTGAPALTLERNDAASFWSDLGTRWRIREQYFKAYPVCRWAQPAIEAALALKRKGNFEADDIAEIAIDSFAESVALGAGCAVPITTDEAQYSLPYPVAAALVCGQVGAAEVGQPMLAEPRVRRLLSVMKLTEDPEFSRRFPAERWSRVRITLRNGRVLLSEPAVARGNPENPLTDDEIRSKYRALAEPVLGSERSTRIEDAVDGLGYGAQGAQGARGAATCLPLLEELLSAGHG